MPGRRARTALAAGAAARFGDVRWVEETGSTNADLMALARRGEPEGMVLVADHQTAGRGRAERRWNASPRSGLLMSVLLRPPAVAVDLCTMVIGLAATEAVEVTSGVTARLKWPNDLVWPGDSSGPDRKLAGILAEANWATGCTPAGGWREPAPGDKAVVIVGIGINVAWPAAVPDELADVAVAISQLTPTPVDREDLLIALLRALAPRYAALVAGDRGSLLAEWRARSATLGRRVRVELGDDDVEGTAVDVTDDGHLVVETLEGPRRTFAAGDVVHLR